MGKELWKAIKGYEGIYEASSHGRIRTCFGKSTNSVRHGERIWKQRIMKYKGYTPNTGYRVSLFKNKSFKDYLVARLIAFTFFDKDINNLKLTVNHINGDRMDNHIENLELISLADNIRHGFQNGLYSCCKPIILFDVKSNKELYFYSSAQANRYIGKSHSFIQNQIKKNKLDLKDYLIVIKEK